MRGSDLITVCVISDKTGSLMCEMCEMRPELTLERTGRRVKAATESSQEISFLLVSSQRYLAHIRGNHVFQLHNTLPSI